MNITKLYAYNLLEKMVHLSAGRMPNQSKYSFETEEEAIDANKQCEELDIQVNELLSSMSREELKELYEQLLKENEERLVKALEILNAMDEERNQPDYEYDPLKRNLEAETIAAEGEAWSYPISLVKRYRYSNLNKEDYRELSIPEMLDEEFELKAVINLTYNYTADVIKQDYKTALIEMNEIRVAKEESTPSTVLRTAYKKMLEKAEEYKEIIASSNSNLHKNDNIKEYLKDKDEDGTTHSLPRGTHFVKKGIYCMIDNSSENSKEQILKYSEDVGLQSFINNHINNNENSVSEIND